MGKAIDWNRGHTPATATLTATYSAVAVAMVGQDTGLPASWVMGSAAVGAAGSVISGAAQELTKSSIGLRVAAWLSAGGWTSWAIQEADVWAWSTIGPLLAMASGFGATAGVMSVRKKKADKRNAELDAAAERSKKGNEWSNRVFRVCHLDDCEIVGVEEWKDEQGNKTNAGFTLEVKLPGGGSTWRTIASQADALAADADLPEGCGIEVFQGKTRGTCLIQVSTRNALFEVIDLPKDASALDFTEDFDIGVHRDATREMVNMRQNSGILSGEKRSGKTNQLQTFISRFVRMPNLLVWVVDYNAGGVALPWLQAWDELGRPGPPPIDWVASTDAEVKEMGKAAVRIAKARKAKYQKLMRQNNTDLLPLTPDLPGVLIITDEGAELFGDMKKRDISAPFVEALRIAGAVGVNELSCFLRATSDATGDPMVKQQSRLRVGMRMADDQEIGYLFGWNAKIKPEDMPHQGFGASTMEPSTGKVRVFKGYRVLPDDINWMVENTTKHRTRMDDVSLEAAGEIYKTRWADDRAGYLFEGSDGSRVPVTPSGHENEEEDNENMSKDVWDDSRQLDPEQVKHNLRKAVEDAGGPTVQEQDDFERVLNEAGVVDRFDPRSWPDGQRPVDLDEDEQPEDDANMKDIVFGIVKAMSPEGATVQEVIDALTRTGQRDVPTRQTVTRWLKDDDRVWKPTGYGKYAVKPEGN